MPEPAGWRIYPVGPLASVARAAGSTLISIPLVAMLMILPFLAVRYVADKGAFGVDASGLAWSAWAELAVGLAVLAFAFGTLGTALLSLVRTVATVVGLRRWIRRGERDVDVPHPQQWEMATDWSGTSLIISSLITTAVLAFPGMLTTPVRTWVEEQLVLDGWAFIPLPVIVIAVVVAFRLWRKKPLAELDARWTQAQRSAAETTASARVPNLPTDADGDVVNPATIHRHGLDAVGDRINSAGLWTTAIAVLAAAVTLPVGTSMIGYGFASTPAEALILLSSVLLLAVAVALYVLGAVLQNAAQSAELRTLFAAARRPQGPAPGLSVLARYWKPTETPWVDSLGLVGALLLLLAVPALLLPGPGAAERWGTVGGVAAVAVLLTATVVDVAAEHGTREPRNLVLKRWPIPDPSTMNKERRVDAAVEADVERYGQRSDAHTEAAAVSGRSPVGPPFGPGVAGGPDVDVSRYPRPSGSPHTAPVAGPPPPPVNGAYPSPQRQGGYPPPHGAHPSPQPQGPYPPQPLPSATAGPPPSPPSRSNAARRPWGLAKKLRGRGLGDLYR